MSFLNHAKTYLFHNQCNIAFIFEPYYFGFYHLLFYLCKINFEYLIKLVCEYEHKKT